MGPLGLTLTVTLILIEVVELWCDDDGLVEITCDGESLTYDITGSNQKRIYFSK